MKRTGAAIAAMALLCAGGGRSSASTVSFEPDERILGEARYVSEAVVTASTVKREKCLYRRTVRMTLTDPIRGVRPTTKPVVLIITDHPYDPGCMGVSYTTPPRASRLDKGARIIVAVACIDRDKCSARASWDATERPRIEKELEKLGRAERHEKSCAAAAAGARAKKKVDEVAIAKDVATPPTRAGVTARWTGAGHKIDGPGILDLSLARAGKTAALRSLSDEFGEWKRADEVGVCWRVIEAEDFEPMAAVLQIFVVR